MGKKEKKDKKKGKSQPPTQTSSFTGTSRRSSNYGAVPVQGSPSPSPTRRNLNLSVQRKSSPVVVPLSLLNDDEYEFFSMVSSGDTKGVIKYLNSPDFEKNNKNINRFNKHGYTALHMAVRRQDEELITILLKKPNIKLYDTILHAIREDNLEITQFLLRINDQLMKDEGTIPSTTNLSDNEESEKAKFCPGKSGISTSIRPTTSRTSVTGLSGSRGRVSVSGSASSIKKDPRDDIDFDSEFHTVITPLMLAAHVGSTQLMQLFYKRGERLETKEFHHNLNCSCDICAKLDGDGKMTQVYQRYHLFKAICQPEYICLMAQKMQKDPVNYAIDKIVKLRHIMKWDYAYDQMYAEFIEELEKFCTDMLSLCRDTLETRTFLSPKDTLGKERLPHLYPRLWYTVGLDMKNFVAHSGTQNVVYHTWASDSWPDWETYSFLYRLFHLAIRIIAFPIIAMILFVADGTDLAKSLGSPIGRFLNYVASYFIFLGLVGIQVAYKYQRCNDDGMFSSTQDDDTCMQRGPPNIGTEWFIFVYILSFCVSTLKRHSVSWYWNMKWNWFDLVFIFSFFGVFACWTWAWIYVEDPENAAEVSATINRLQWKQSSPEVIGESFLAIATMFAYGRLLRFLQIFEVIGPLQVCLGKQIAAFFSTSFMFLIILISAAAAMTGIYRPYKEFKGFDDHGRYKEMDDEFCTMSSTFYHLFLHLGDPDAAGDMLAWPPLNGTDSDERIEHKFNQRTGKVILVLFHIIGLLMMYNMLTGYFGQTMTDILGDSDRVWKFTRTEMYLTHLKDTVLPPPFNLIPTLRTMGTALRYFTLLGKTDGRSAACSFRQCCYISGNKKEVAWKNRTGSYRELILKLVFRYYNFRKWSQDKEECTRDDVLEIGEEITELKEKLRMDGKVGEQNNNDEEDSEDDDFYSKMKSRKRSNHSPGGSGSGGTASQGPSTPSKPVTSQPHGSPQAGPSGITTINMSPASKPPPVPRNQVAGLYISSPNMPKNQNPQMGSYHNPPKVKQRSYSSSLMNVSSLERDLNRNESDSLYGSTTVAHAGMPQNYPFFDDSVPMQHYNFNDRDLFPWEKSPSQKYPDQPLFFQDKTTPLHPWEQSAFQQFPLPVVRENVTREEFDRSSPATAGMEQPNSWVSSTLTWDDESITENYPPPYFRGRPKQY